LDIDGPFKPSIHECLSIIGRLPNLKKLRLDFESNIRRPMLQLDLLRLIPAAARLSELFITDFAANLHNFSELIRRMTKLQYVNVHISKANNWPGYRRIVINRHYCDDVLRALSFLPSLEILILDGEGILSLESASSLSRIVCERLYVENEIVRAALHDSFIETVEPSTKEGHFSGARELTLADPR